MRRAVLALVVASALLAGCGGGASRLSSDQLIDRATVICSQAAHQMARIGTPKSPSGGMQFLNRGIAVLTPELAKLRLLEPPKGDIATVYRTSMQAFEQKLAAMRATVRRIKAGDSTVTAISALSQKLAPIEASEDGAWRALQVPACLNL